MTPKKSTNKWIQWGVGIAVTLLLSGFKFATNAIQTHAKHDDARFLEVHKDSKALENSLKMEIKEGFAQARDTDKLLFNEISKISDYLLRKK